MNKEKYLADRKVLTDAAQALIDDGKLEDFTAKKGEITELDNQYEAAGRAQANLNALTALPGGAAPFVEVGTAGNVITLSGGAAELEDIYDSADYKKAFMRNVVNGTPIPSKFLNADANTKTGDVGTVIPTTTMQKIVEKMESIGMILPLVTHTSYVGGLVIPTSSVKPVATWVAEGAGSPKQKKATGSITFAQYKLRCAISMSLEVSVMAYPIFEAQFVQNVADAMVKAKEQAIISGTGSGQPKGILAETPNVGQELEIAKDTKVTYEDLTKIEAAIPQAYDAAAIYAMTKKTFMTQIVGMVDINKQPVARMNYGINGRPEYSIFGRRVIFAGDYMDSWAVGIAKNTIIMFVFNFADYVMNTNYNVTVKRYTDDNTDDEIMKAVELVDGKVVDKGSLVTVTLKSV